ncbi:MAG TPA: hypothetical protein VF258_07800, partial [Luteolibacter sp.]
MVQPAFNVIQKISVLPTWPSVIHADDIFSLLAENPVPGEISFADVRGWFLLKNVAVASDRWDWAIAPVGAIIPFVLYKDSGPAPGFGPRAHRGSGTGLSRAQDLAGRRAESGDRVDERSPRKTSYQPLCS